MSWLISVFVLGVLILVHELGHFVVARWSGVRVLRFSIGFGPKLWGWRRGGTDYVVSLIPLGGYVKLVGEQREEATTSTAGDFITKPASVRARIIAAGPLVNYLTSILTLWVVLIIGYPELLPTVGRLVDGMPAQAAGLQVGDRVVAVDGAPIRTWEDLTKVVHRTANRSLAVEVDREGRRLTVPVTPASQEITDPFGRQQRVGLIGIAPRGDFEPYRVSPLEAVGKTVTKQLEWTSQIGLSLWSLLTGRISPKDSLTGPIGILYLTSEAARMGLGSLLYLVSLFSLSLAIFNLFPIPILDGGHLLFLALEKLRGRPVSIGVQERAAQISLAVLMTMVVLVCVNDVSRFGLVDKVLGWWRN